jgi:hypothetical protein
MVCLTCAAFVNNSYVKCWRLNDRKQEWIFPVSSSIWLMKTIPEHNQRGWNVVLLVLTTKETTHSEWKSPPPPRSKKFSIDKGKRKFMLEGFLTARIFFIHRSSLKFNLWLKGCTLTSFVALGMRSEGNAPKNLYPTYAQKTNTVHRVLSMYLL